MLRTRAIKTNELVVGKANRKNMNSHICVCVGLTQYTCVIHIHSENSVFQVFLFSLVEIHFKFLAAITIERHPSGNFDACEGTYTHTHTTHTHDVHNGYYFTRMGRAYNDYSLKLE